MSDLDDIISLSIVVNDRAPEKPGFGVPMLVDYHAKWTDRVREYSRADDMLDDGFLTTDALYLAARALKSQSPSPSRFKIGRLANIYTQTVDLLPRITAEGHKYDFWVNGVNILHTVPASATIASVATALELLVEAVTGIASTATATAVNAVSTPGSTFAYLGQRGLDMLDLTADPGLAADLAAIADEDNDWYGLITIPTSDAIVKAAAAWAEANGKIYVPQSADWNIIDSGETTDLASDLVALAYTRTAGIWHRHIGGSERADVAWLATMLTPDPGSSTPAFKALAGISADDLRTGERSALTAKKWTRYVRQGGQNITFEGRTPSGRFIDVTRFVDWQHAEIQADCFAVFINTPKVEFENSGISLMKGAISGALRKGQEKKGLAETPAPTVTVPDVSETDTADRANRILRDIEFTGRLSGALHGLVINGTVSV